jgi:hypothetical protein
VQIGTIGGEIRSDGVDRLHGARLIVRVHDRNKQGLWCHGIDHSARVDVTRLIRADQGYFEALFFEPREGFENCLVLDGGGDDVPPTRTASVRRQAENGEVIAFGRATGEDDLVWLRRDRTPDLISSFVYMLERAEPILVSSATSVAILALEQLDHEVCHSTV